MDSIETEICQYLKSYSDQFVSRKEICRRAGGKWRFREDENWAGPILHRMLEKNLVETDGTGHFRLASQERNEKRKRKPVWISPEISAILRRSGRDFDVIDLDKEMDSKDLAAIFAPATGDPLGPQEAP